MDPYLYTQYADFFLIIILCIDMFALFSSGFHHDVIILPAKNMLKLLYII